MNLTQETSQIVANAQAAYKRGEITAQQFMDVTRIPLKDMELKKVKQYVIIYWNGQQYPVADVVIYENGQQIVVRKEGEK